jgi:hypothetical protein
MTESNLNDDIYYCTIITREGTENTINNEIVNILDKDDIRRRIIDDFDIIFVIHHNSNIVGVALCEILNTERSNTEKSSINNKCDNNMEKSLFIDSFVSDKNHDRIDELLLSEIIDNFNDNKDYQDYKYLISSPKIDKFYIHHDYGFKFIDCSNNEIGEIGENIIKNKKTFIHAEESYKKEVTNTEISSPILELCNQLIENNLLTTRLDNSGNKLYTSGFKMTLKRENIPQSGGGHKK